MDYAETLIQWHHPVQEELFQLYLLVAQVVLQDGGVEHQLHLIFVLDRQQHWVAQILDLIVEIDAVHVRQITVA